MNKSTARLRGLALRVREIAALPVQQVRREQWRKLNDLEMVKPMVYTRDYPWEMVAPDGELAPTIADGFLSRLEFKLMSILFEWERFQADRVVDPVIECPAHIANHAPILFKVSVPGRGEELTDRRSNAEFTAEHYIRRIFGEDDIAQVIPMPRITCDRERQDREFGIASEIFDGILEVRKAGVPLVQFTPWDDLLKLFGIEEGMTDLCVRPELMHRAMERFTDAYIETLRQYEALGLLQGNAGNVAVGSGALGYVSGLNANPGAGARAAETWGFCTDQIFTSVSPRMQEEFAAAHELRWMERFGLTYYGCCERLDHKIGILRQFPNLRKISVSPYSDRERAMEAIGRDYVVSFKPNSMLLAESRWDMEASRREILDACALARKYGCALEIVMKTMITLGGQPWRLTKWCEMASETAANA